MADEGPQSSEDGSAIHSPIYDNDSFTRPEEFSSPGTTQHISPMLSLRQLPKYQALHDSHIRTTHSSMVDRLFNHQQLERQNTHPILD
ncbi:hypothetical protein V5O48_012228 [Marasmius crinis-equi]|uniref:Uncharacterized protein n=1 Tax=Marasmius crinis-equi TaxID=585013 RepID=A0ABR3F3D6_9AGAR